MNIIFIAGLIIVAFFAYKIISGKMEQRRAFHQKLYDEVTHILHDHRHFLGEALQKDLWTDWEGDMDTSTWDMAVDKFTAEYLDPLIDQYFPDRIKMCKERKLARDNVKIMIDGVARDNATKAGVHTTFQPQEA